MFKKLALLLSVLAVSKFAFANTGSDAAGKAHEEGHVKAHEEHGKAHEDHGKGHEKAQEHHQGKKGAASK